MKAETLQKDAVIQEFLRRISSVRGRIKNVILFGSRARGDENPYSDYDILIVVENKDRSLVDALYDAAMEVLYRTHRLISLKIYSEADFQRFTARATPFFRNILRDGVPLG